MRKLLERYLCDLGSLYDKGYFIVKALRRKLFCVNNGKAIRIVGVLNVSLSCCLYIVTRHELHLL